MRDAARSAPRGASALGAGLLLGIGLGGMLDGIVLHELLQWHSMLSARVPRDSVADMHVNMLADGVFHAATWLVTVAGIARLVAHLRYAPQPWNLRRLWGAALMGWGLFNLVEGLVNHHLLGLHHVLERAPDHRPFDFAFLALGALLVAAGGTLYRRAGRNAGA
jgi:uncharacterized membrane protein